MELSRLPVKSGRGKGKCDVRETAFAKLEGDAMYLRLQEKAGVGQLLGASKDSSNSGAALSIRSARLLSEVQLNQKPQKLPSRILSLVIGGLEVGGSGPRTELPLADVESLPSRLTNREGCKVAGTGSSPQLLPGTLRAWTLPGWMSKGGRVRWLEYSLLNLFRTEALGPTAIVHICKSVLREHCGLISHSSPVAELCKWNTTSCKVKFAPEAHLALPKR